MGKSLILGGAGFMGANLLRSLVAAGERPRVFNRPSYSLGNIDDLIDEIEISHGDFMDDVSLRRATEGVDTVYHLISTTFPSMTVESSVYDVLSNLLPTIRLVEICRAAGIRKIVYASSGGTIYGEPVTVPITEEHPLVPTSAYGQSKLTIENYLSFYARLGTVDVSVLRVSNPYGPGQNPLGVQGLVAVAMGCALRDRTLKIFGEGDIVRDYIYVEDVIRAMQLAARRPGSEVMNVSSGTGRSVMEIVETIERVSGRTIRKELVPERPGDVRVNVLANERARQLLDWQPEVEFEAGIQRTWRWMSERHAQLSPTTG